MGFGKVLGNNVATLFVYMSFLPYYFDSSSTWAGTWFHYVHIFEVLNFPIAAPFFVVFGHNISRGSYFIGLTENPPHPLNITPHQILTPDAPAASKMVHFLKLINIFYPLAFKETCPKNVPWVSRGHMVEASHFQRVYDWIIGMGRVMKLKTELRRWLEFLLIILDNSRHVLWQWALHI